MRERKISAQPGRIVRRIRLDLPLPIRIRGDLFPGTSHSPYLAELVGYKRAADIVHFRFIANPDYAAPEMLVAVPSWTRRG